MWNCEYAVQSTSMCMQYRILYLFIPMHVASCRSEDFYHMQDGPERAVLAFYREPRFFPFKYRFVLCSNSAT